MPYQACEKICVPYQAELELILPPGPATATRFVQLIDRYHAAVPGSADASDGTAVVACGTVKVRVWPVRSASTKSA